MKNINIDDGREAICINDDPERVIYIQASDLNIQLRAEQAQRNIENMLSELDDINSESNEALVEMLETVDKGIREQVNFIFNYDVSAPVFGSCSPLMLLKTGKSYIEEFLEAITPVIKECAEKAAKASEKRVSKYAKRYEK